MSASDSKPDSRKCIIHAAARLFARLGLDKCSTREIAKESEANISLISYYFGGKEGLYKEVMRNYALEIKENTQTIFNYSEKNTMSKAAFIDEIKEMVDIMIRLRVKNPEMSQIFAREKLTGMPYAKEVHDEIFYPMVTQFFKIFKQGQEAGVVKKEINAAFFFVTLSEGLWGFFEIHACETSMNQDFGDLATNHIELRNQILNIYLTGVLV